MVQGIIIPADDKAPLRAATFEMPEDFDRAVDEWAEAVHIPHVGVRMHLNLEGSNRQLSYNRRATFLWWFYIPGVRGEARLLGDIVLVGLAHNEEESADLTIEIRRQLLEPGVYRVRSRERGGGRWHEEPIDRDDYLETVIWATLLMEMSSALEVQIACIGYGGGARKP